MKSKQSGAVLLVGIVMLMVLSLVVIMSAKTSVLQQKMTTNQRDKELSFQAAESALRAGESYIKNTEESTLSTIFNNTNGLYQFDKTKDFGRETTWANLSTVETSTHFQVKEKAFYLIEELPSISAIGASLAMPKADNSHYYRITSRSKGGTDNTRTVLQSVYKKSGG